MGNSSFTSQYQRNSRQTEKKWEKENTTIYMLSYETRREGEREKNT